MVAGIAALKCRRLLYSTALGLYPTLLPLCNGQRSGHLRCNRRGAAATQLECLDSQSLVFDYHFILTDTHWRQNSNFLQFQFPNISQ